MSERIEYDILLVGGSPANLTLAHRLLDLAKASGQRFSMAILEKGPEFGAHILSGAVSKPHVIERLFPDYRTSGFPVEAVCDRSHLAILGARRTWEVPNALLPAGLRKEGYLILTLSHVVKWMADQLAQKAKDVPNVTLDLFPGFSAHEILYDGDRVIGVQVVETPSGNPQEDAVYARVTCFGDKGFTSGRLIDRFQLRQNPQLWSVGVKEVWELPAARGAALKGAVWHTMGYPLTDGSFGGGFVYGMDRNRLTLGLVISLDSENPNINPQQALQAMKKHPWIQGLIADGKLLKYGAALLPEGGYYSLPQKFAVDGALLLGDALGTLNITTLAGVDKAMECGWQAADVLHASLASSDFSQAALAPYQEKLMATHVGQELFEGRYFRHAWKENPRLLTRYLPRVTAGVDSSHALVGMAMVGLTNNPLQAIGDALRLKTLMDGRTDIGPLTFRPDHSYIVPAFQPPAAPAVPEGFQKDTIYSREDAVFYANPVYHEHNHHIDEFSAETCLRCIATYDRLGKCTPCVSDCTAEVHRVDVVQDLRQHAMSLENCVQCRTCEIVCPEQNLRVRPTEQGSGPDFMGL